MTHKHDGGPAFPLQSIGPEFAAGYSGMSLRDYFAAKAMQGMSSICLSDDDMIMGWSDMASAAYEAADAMLKARQS